MDEFFSSDLWDLKRFWETDDPNFTLFFEKTVLVWLPCAFLWISLPVEVYHLCRSRSLDIPLKLNPYNISKLTAIIVLEMIALVDNIQYLIFLHSYFRADFYSPFIKFLTFVLFFALTFANVKCGRRSSAVLFLFSLILVIFGAPQFWTEFRLRASSMKEGTETMEFVSYVVYYVVVIAVFIMNCFADGHPQKPPDSVDKNVCPKNQSSFLSQLLFAWFEPLIWKGYRKSLENDDLWDLDYSISSANIVPKFEKHWRRSLEKVQRIVNFKRKNDAVCATEIKYSLKNTGNKYASIVPSLYRTFGTTFVMGTLIKIFLDVFAFVNPKILSLLINFMGSDDPPYKGYLYAMLLFLIGMIQTVLMSQYQHTMHKIGLKIRTSLISIIYKKALRISNGARRNFTIGEMVNLISVDACRFADLLSSSYLLISTPIQVAFAIFFLWNMLGPGVLSSLIFLIISVLVNSYVAWKIKLLQSEQMKKKDDRIKLMNQILCGIKVLKLHAWEPSFEKQVLSIRNEETKILEKHAYLTGITTFVWSYSTFLVYLAALAVYILSSDNNILDAEVALVSLALFNVLKLPILMMPKMLSNLVQSYVSVRRIDKFLNSEELDSEDVTHDSRAEALVIENGSFSWEGPKGSPILRGVNIKIDPGALVAIIGPVGSGKSSLISAFLGEMYKLSGIVNTMGTIAYVPQQAWIQNTTLRDNITFGELEANKKIYYNKIVEACALKPDFKILPAADLTEIGEKGINLSGGQKQKVSLARAVYSEADIYFLDDPLSAVDSHVGKHIFERVIGRKGLLKKKTRVLVTHSVTFLPRVDSIIVLKQGSICEFGSYEELLEKKGIFFEFLITYLEQNLESDEEELDKLKEDLIDRKLASEKLIRQNSMRSKRGSIISLERQPSINRQKMDRIVVGQKLIEDEHSETGTIKCDVYTYFARSAGFIRVFLIAFLNCSLQGFSFLMNLWLSKWIDDTDVTEDDDGQDTRKKNFYFSIYALLGLIKAITELFTDISVRIGCWKSAKILHNVMLHNFFRLPLSFMDVTPAGRILSRFSKDIDVVDNSLPDQITGLCFCFGDVICTFLIVSCSTPIFMTTIPIFVILYCFVQRFYVATSRQLKRLESVSRSPIYSHFVETIAGAQSIRAYGLSEKFITLSEEKVDHNHKSYYWNAVSNRWLSVRTETISNLILLFVAIFAVLDRKTLSPGLAGLSICYTLQIALTLSYSVYASSEVETNIVSTERIKEYSEIPPEAPWEIDNESLPQNWPSKGDIEFQDFKVRYRDGLELILKGITFFVSGGQKIGIVGRTGAGKSSLTLSLFRILESAGGKIMIDGIDITTLGLHTLRSRLTIIPQDPVLFAGSLRMNLDPFNEYSEDCIWHALELAHLKSYILSLNDKLGHEIVEGGENFSIGQRQLISLARALLRKTKILILDEATAAVDLETDDLIQNTIRNEFKDCTVLTIAHRLNTVMDYDKIVFLDQGCVVEYDSPQNLLGLKNSAFYKMVADAGLA